MNAEKFKRGNNKVIAGVCAGLASMLEMPVGWMRVIFVVTALFTRFLPVMVIYVVLACVMPPAGGEARWNPRQITTLMAVGLISLGLFIIAKQFFIWLDFGLICAILMVAVGAALLVRAFRKRE